MERGPTSATEGGLLTPSRMAGLERPVPRYTSYPPIPVWGELPFEATREALGAMTEPADVYVHLPFCVEQCAFCGCNMVVAGRHEIGRRYVDRLAEDLEGLALPAPQVRVGRIHLGGGTPTWFHADELAELVDLLLTRFRPEPGAELSVEADPAITTEDQLDALRSRGFNRLSLGVQSFDPFVLSRVGRPQPERRVLELVGHARTTGWSGVNFDLMLGLPSQTLPRFNRTLRRAAQIRPDRIAVFPYAHVPHMKPHQRRIDERELPSGEVRAAQAILALEVLTDEGYEPIGMDHFALPHDPLAVAAASGRLHRNFMGYTTRAGVDLVGLGMSAISEVAGVYWQAPSKLADWLRGPSVDGRVRGYRMTREDRLRRDVIHAILCNLHLDISAWEVRWGLRFHEHFAETLERLQGLRAMGICTWDARSFRVSPQGRLLVRQVASAFDAWLA